MKRLWAVGILGFVVLFWGCSSDEPQRIEPQSKGQRGEACQARNDCKSGLACISGVCSRNDFDVAVTAKHCDRVDCQATTDCCGDKPTEAPAECANRDVICSAPTLPGCIPSSCTAAADCASGVCGQGSCSNVFASCEANTDCADRCLAGFCTLSASSCDADTDCLYGNGTCQGRSCSCTNPQYNPTNPVCSNPDCVDVCLLKCEDERCVADTSCEVNTDCFNSLAGRICNAGKCVECLADTNCDVEDGESCVNNQCKKPCTLNEECPLFHQCQSGECIETGCNSDRECVLAASRNDGRPSEDARLLKCLPSDLKPEIKTCKIPCENDGACGSEFEVCDNGYCKFIGCDSNEECRSYLGISNQETTPAQPFIPKAVCRE